MRGTGIGLCDLAAPELGDFAPGLPRFPCDLRIAVFERGELANLVEITLELRNMRDLTVVAAHVVKDFLEDRKQCIGVRLGNHIRLLVDIEQDRF